MTHVVAVGPRHPVVVSALGEHATLVAAQLADDLAQLRPQPRVVELVAAGARADTLPEQLTPADLERVFREMLQAIDPDDASDLPGVAWVVLAELDGDINSEGWRLLLGPLVDTAARLRTLGYRFTFTLVLVDGSAGTQSPLAAGLHALAEALQDERLVSMTQVYLLRRRLRRGWLLTDADLLAQTRLAARVLVLNWADPRHIERDLSTVVGASLLVVGQESARLQIFGRLGLRLLRWQRGEIAARCATERMEGFAERHIRSGRHVPLHWEPELIEVRRPEFTPEADASVGERLRSGPARRFSGRPAVFRPPLAELRRLETDADEWVAALRQWRHDVRVAFSSVLGRVRSASASERNRVRDAVSEQAREYWLDPEREYPLPYLHEWLDRQHREWDATDEERQTRAAGLRLTEQDDPRDVLAAPFAALRAELSVRPNVWVLTLCCLLVTLGSVAVLWEMLGNLGGLAAEVSWLGPESAESSALLRAMAIPAAVGIALIAAGSAYYRTRLRWDSAYSQLVAQTEEVANAEREALQREIFLVDLHWYDKTVSAGLRHLERLHARLRMLERHLARIRSGSTAAPAGRSRIVRTIGDDDHLVIREHIPDTRVDALLRTPAMAAQWVSGDADRWVHDAQALLAREFAAVGTLVGGDPKSAADREVRTTLSTWEQNAEESIALDAAGNLTDAPRHTLLYATGDLAEIAAAVVHNGSGPRVDVVEFPGERDELIICTAQMGLTADVACNAS